MKQLFMILIYILFLPPLLLRDIYKSQRSLGKKIAYFTTVTVIFGLVWWSGFKEAYWIVNYNLFQTGVVDKITKIKVSGTSMLPTIKDGDEVSLNNHKKYGLARGDIVSFSNDETNNLFYIKRIIGMSGESVFIRNGYYYINNKALDEDYTLNNLPTFGNTFLPDCESVIVPPDSYFVSGDNRTVSVDSRVLGFIHRDDIEGVIKTNISEKFIDEAKQKEITKSGVKSDIFLKKLNETRVNNKGSSLVTHDSLNGFAKKRAEQIKTKFSDWKGKTIPIEKLLDEEGYRFNQVHEFVTFGYLDEQAVLDQVFDSVIEKDHFLSNQYTEVGIGISEITNKECTFPIISVILSWPAVPTYPQETLDSWVKEIELNKQSLSNLQTWVGYPGLNQEKLKRLINLVAQMQQIATRVYDKEKEREWLTEKDYQDIKLYDSLVKESVVLDEEIFGKR